MEVSDAVTLRKGTKEVWGPNVADGGKEQMPGPGAEASLAVVLQSLRVAAQDACSPVWGFGAPLSGDRVTHPG